MKRAARAACALVVLIAALGVPSARGAVERCAGNTPTIWGGDLGVGSVIEGTDGPDVIQGADYEEIILAKRGKDIVCGGGGGDLLDGGPGNDKLLGEAGNDEFRNSEDEASLGLVADQVIGGSGDRDSATYLNSPVAVQVDLGKEKVVGGGESSRIQGIEIVNGSEFADKLVGNRFENEIKGRDGNDLIDGRAGGDDLFGGLGNDIVSYATAPAAVKLGLITLHAQVGGENGDVDEIYGFERAEGSDFDDKLKGDEQSNEFSGGLGDDVLKGFSGDDILAGGEGDDMIHPGLGDDFVDGGPSDPVTSTGEHGDLATYANDEIDPANDELHQQFEARLTPDRFDNPPGSSGVGEDVFASIESIRGVPGVTNIIYGDDGPNVLIGGNRTDVLEARGGNDLLFGLGAGDSLYGEAGDDYLDGGMPVDEPPDRYDSDRLDGGDGTDTCIGAGPGWIYECENVQQRR